MEEYFLKNSKAVVNNKSKTRESRNYEYYMSTLLERETRTTEKLSISFQNVFILKGIILVKIHICW